MKSFPLAITNFGIRIILCLTWLAEFGFACFALWTDEYKWAIILMNLSWFTFIMFIFAKRRP